MANLYFHTPAFTMSSTVTRLLLVLCLLIAPALGRAQVIDDFADLDFTSGTVWSGDAGLFTAVTGQLQSQSPGAAGYYLSTPSTLATDAQWEFFVNLKFSTSGANYADVFVMSTASALTGGVNGYFVRIGGTNDRVELFRSDSGVNASLIAGPDGIVNSSTDNPFLIRVKRTGPDSWTLEYDDGAGGSYTLAGSAVDATYGACSHVGIRIEQSSAAGPINNHFFDDINAGPIPVDVTPPSILSVVATNATNVDVQYSEQLDPGFIGNYDIIPFIGVSAQVLDGVDPSLVHVTPAIALASGTTYTLSANATQDLAGNAMVTVGIDFTYVVPAVAGPGDVVINEIMADPQPVVGIPDAEFAEVHNTTATATFDLAGWTFTDGSTTATLPAFLLAPGAYAVITDDASAALFTGVPNVIAVTTFPSLNNDGDPLELKNDAGTLIDAVSYELSWYQDAVKEDGGWTLERIDPSTPCSSAANWTACDDPDGGTPAAQNSVFAIVTDTTEPVLLSVQVNSATEIVLLFSETMDAASLVAGSYAIDPPIGVAGAAATGPATATLALSDPLVVGQLYTITVTNVADCPGNAIGAGNSVVFALPEQVAMGDVVINEVLYDPRSGGYDFVELYNTSDKVLSLAGWKLANEEDGAIANGTVITALNILFLPGTYWAITENPANIAAEYPFAQVDRILEADLPGYNNGEGSVVLLAPDDSTLDLFRYTDDLHFALLNSTEGVSLERVDPARPTGDATNWHSASEAVGWATPGYENSQYAPTAEASGEMTIEPAILSPDNDGYQDLLTITYAFDQPGFAGTMKVFDLAGREVAVLMENELLGTRGAVSWDGTQADKSLARIGPYVVLFTALDLAGAELRFRETVVVAQKLQ